MSETMLKKNDEVECEIERLGVNGEGIASYNGKIVFIPFACVGERVLAHVIFDKKDYFVAKVVKVLRESNDRVQAPCPYFGKCGGCDVQHLNYISQLALKKIIVETALNKYAKINAKVNDVVASEKQYRYRNKFSFPVGCDVDGNIKIGMFKKNSHEIIEIEDCLLQSERAKKIISIFKNFMISQNVSAYNESTKKGIVKHIVVREHAESFILTVVVTDEKFNNFEPLITQLNNEFNSFGIIKNVNKLNNNVIFGKEDYFIYGLSELRINEFNLNYSVNNRSFLQVNDYIKYKIYEKIIDSIKDHRYIIDAYSGAGLLSAILATHAENVYGIEIVPEATKNADELKIKNELNNLTNICGDCAKVLPELANKLKSDFSLILDPPRKGVSEEVLGAVLNSEPSQIIYLSCNPATLARDLNSLKEKYEIEYIQPYDMFPQTANVETLVCLNIKDQNGRR